MVIYTLSSTDPQHFNRIQTKLPTELSSRFVNVCVTSLTSNCNIEVMNADDYITFVFRPPDSPPTTRKVLMTPYSKLTSASLPYVLQDIFNAHTIPVTVSLSNLDTLIFTSDTPFDIVDMSYNMKLITGFYPHKDDEYPIPSVEDEEAYSVIDRTNKPLTDFTALDLNMRTHDVRPIKYLLTPPDAYGFNVQLRSENEDIARVEQNLVLGIAPGDANIIVEVRNPDTLLTSAPDFTDTVTVRVADSIRTRIESVDLPASITLYTSESTTLYPDITPVNAGFYVDSWESDKPEFASVVSGFIRAHQPGTAIITYRITNNHRHHHLPHHQQPRGGDADDRETGVRQRQESHRVPNHLRSDRARCRVHAQHSHSLPPHVRRRSRLLQRDADPRQDAVRHHLDGPQQQLQLLLPDRRSTEQHRHADTSQLHLMHHLHARRRQHARGQAAQPHVHHRQCRA